MDKGSIRWLRVSSVPGVDVMDVRGVSRKWNHHHETYTICVMNPDGRAPHAEWLYRQRTYEMGPGGTMLMEPGEFHTNLRPAPVADFSVVLVGRDQFVKMLADVRGFSGRAPALRLPQLREPRLLAKMHAALAAMIAADGARVADHLLEYVHLLCEHDVFEQFVPASRAPVGAGCVRRARELIQEHWNEELPLTEITRELGVPASTLSHCFRAKVGLGLRQYKKRIRLERARQLLRATRLPIVRVVAECGYADPATFSREFKAMFGVAPSEYLGMGRTRSAGQESVQGTPERVVAFGRPSRDQR